MTEANLIRVPGVTRDTPISDAVEAFYAVWPASQPYAHIAELTDGGFAIAFDDAGIERPALGMNLAANGFKF